MSEIRFLHDAPDDVQELYLFSVFLFLNIIVSNQMLVYRCQVGPEGTKEVKHVF